VCGFVPPPIAFKGRLWPAEEVADLAIRHRDAFLEHASTPLGSVAIVMANRPESVALFFGLSCLGAPLVILPAEPKAWRSVPAIPLGTPVAMLSRFRDLAPEAERLGLRPVILPDPPPFGVGAREPAAFLGCPGLVLFTSGSTGAPKPVFRSMASVLADVSVRASTAGLEPGDGVACCLPLDRAFGVNEGMLLATTTGSQLGLLEKFTHHALLALFASGEYGYWAGTPLMAHMLARAAGRRSHSAPRFCTVAGRLADRVARAFRERFDVPLRGHYGSTETGRVSADLSPPDRVRPETVGHVMPGVQVHIGDDPRAALPAGRTGRIWIRSPWYLDGCGFPPLLEFRGDQDGWWPTRDLGWVDEGGYLTLAGRLDDVVRTAAGHLVDVWMVTAALSGYPGVTDVAVVPLESSGGTVIGALVESDAPLDAAPLRQHLAGALSPWCQPRVLEMTRALPRLADGKVDRSACIAALGQVWIAG